MTGNVPLASLNGMDEKPCRIIYSLEIELEPPNGHHSAQLIIPLWRDGTAQGTHSNGTPRPPKTRAIDLRAGDQVLVDGRWRRVLGVKAYRQHWLTEAEADAAAIEDGAGFVWRAKSE